LTLPVGLVGAPGEVERYLAALDHPADGIGPFGLNEAAPGYPAVEAVDGLDGSDALRYTASGRTTRGPGSSTGLRLPSVSGP
jgi:hypothetical protein